MSTSKIVMSWVLSCCFCIAQESVPPQVLDEPALSGEESGTAGGTDSAAGSGAYMFSPDCLGMWNCVRSQYHDNIVALSNACASEDKKAALASPALVEELDVGSAMGAATMAAMIGFNSASSVSYLEVLVQAIENNDPIIFDSYDYIATYFAILCTPEARRPLVDEALAAMRKSGRLPMVVSEKAKYLRSDDYMKATLYLLCKDVSEDAKAQCAENLRNSEQADPFLRHIAPPPAPAQSADKKAEQDKVQNKKPGKSQKKAKKG